MSDPQVQTPHTQEDFSAKAVRAEQKKVAQMREQLQAEQKALAKQKAQYDAAMSQFKQIASELKSNPMSVLQKVGWTDEALAEHLSTAGAPKQQEDVQQSAIKPSMTQDDIQKYVMETLAKERIGAYVRDIDAILDTGDYDWAVKFDPRFIRQTSLDIHSKFMSEKGRPPSPQEAVDLIEESLVDQVAGLAASKRIYEKVKTHPEMGSLFAPPPAPVPEPEAVEPAAAPAGEPDKDVTMPAGGFGTVNEGVSSNPDTYWLQKAFDILVPKTPTVDATPQAVVPVDKVVE